MIDCGSASDCLVVIIIQIFLIWNWEMVEKFCQNSLKKYCVFLKDLLILHHYFSCFVYELMFKNHIIHIMVRGKCLDQRGNLGGHFCYFSFFFLYPRKWSLRRGCPWVVKFPKNKDPSPKKTFFKICFTFTLFWRLKTVIKLEEFPTSFKLLKTVKQIWS